MSIKNALPLMSDMEIFVMYDALRIAQDAITKNPSLYSVTDDDVLNAILEEFESFHGFAEGDL